jgi:hypothetical protein
MVMHTMKDITNSYFHFFQKYVCTKKLVTPHTQLYMAKPSATSVVFMKIPQDLELEEIMNCAIRHGHS